MPRPGWDIKPLTTTRLPQSRVVLSAQAALGGDRAGYTETWRCAALRTQVLDDNVVLREESRTFFSDAVMWDHIHDHARGKGLTFLWVYDLSWTARVTRIFDHLPRLGWRLTALSLNPGAPWMAWRRHDAVLKVVDVFSIWPHPLDKIGQWFGRGRAARPLGHAADLVALKAARMDLEILTTAVDTYLAWIEREQLGTLAVTGNGQAWSAFRRRFMDHGILVHHDEALHAMERRAMWAGRAEAFWRGSWLDQPVDEWDFSNAYSNIAATHDMPVFPHGPADPRRSVADYLAEDRYHLLAEVEVNVSKPVVPMERGGAILWPVGRFRTVLWSPEIRAVLDSGGDCRLISGWLYRRAPALRWWAHWILALMAGDDDDCPAWLKDIAKRWGNVLVGRFAMRYPKWELIGVSPHSDVYCTPCFDLDTEDDFLLMQVGHDIWQQVGLTSPNNSAPAITGYVMSALRAKLWQLIDVMPEQTLLYVDTDSLLVTDMWRGFMRQLSESVPGQGLRLKRTWQGMAIYGPRQLVTGDQARVSGLPKAAQRTGRHDWEGETTESLTAAMAGRSAGAVRITPRQWHIEGTDTRRAGTGFGWTHPFHVDQA